MTHQCRKDHIEARLAKDRAALAASATELHDRVSLAGVTRAAAGLAAKGGWRSIGLAAKGARANPVGAALIGAGVAWILFGPKAGRPKAVAKPPSPRATARWEDEGGSFTTPLPDDTWSDELDSLRKMASDRLHQVERDAQAGLKDAYGTARDFVTERAEVVKQFAADLNRTLGIGLENLSGQARVASLKAREQMYVARLEGERLARKGSRMTQDHPLIMGVVGLGIGAALAGMVPKVHSRRADLEAARKREHDLRRREMAVAQRERRLAEVPRSRTAAR